MKKLLLAPALALALSGLVAAPVAAAEPPAETETTSAAPGATSEKSTAESAPTEEPDAQEESKAPSQESKTEEPEQKPAEEPKAEAPKKKTAEAPKKAAAPTETVPEPNDEEESAPAPSEDADQGKDDAAAEEEKPEPIEADLDVKESAVTAEEFAEKGVEIAVTGLKKGDVVKDSTSGTAATVSSDGTHIETVRYQGDPESLEAGTQKISVTVSRKGVSAKTLSDPITIQAEEAFNPQADVSPKKLTQTDFTDSSPYTDESKGVTLTVTGLQPGDKVHNTLSNQHDEIKTGDTSGVLEYRIYNRDDPTAVAPGVYDFDVTVTRDGETKTIPLQIEIVADDELNASLTVIPEEITAADLANRDKGFQITVEGLRAGDTVQDSLTGDKPDTVDGNSFTKRIYWTGEAAQVEPGPVDFTVTVVRGEGEDKQQQELKGTITVIDPKDDDEDSGDDKGDKDRGDDKGDKGEGPVAAAVEASLSVTPEKIEAADFANSDKGVILSVEDCEPGSTVHFKVTPKGINVTAYESTRTADDDGSASVSVFGTSSDASAYVGAYTVMASCGEDAMDGAFTVVGGAAGGSGDSGDLPRTGADLGALTAGAILLLVGGAAVAMTGRKKGGQAPTQS